MTAPNVNATSPAPTTPTPSTSAAPTGAAATQGSTTAAPVARAEDTGFRYGADQGYLAGKTPAEAKALFDQLYQQNQQLAARAWQQPGAPVTAPMQPSYAPSQPNYAPYAQPGPVRVQPPEPPKQEEFLSDPAGATKRYADYLQATQFGPQLQQQAAATAQTNRQLVAMQRADEFKRWGPEIDMTLQQMAPDPVAWTPQNIASVVDIVKARHVNELIAEDRARYANELGGASVRPSAGGGTATSATASNTLDFDKMPPGYRDALKSLNVDQRTIDEFLMRTYIRSGLEPDLDKARDRWTKQVQRGDVFSDHKTLESPVYT